MGKAMTKPFSQHRREMRAIIGTAWDDCNVKRELAEVRGKFSNRDNTKYGKRHRPGVMNQTEQLYADGLYGRKLAGEIIEFQFESVTLKLAPNCTFTPDFFVHLSSGEIEFVDVKGSGPIDDKSIVKIKCAAEKFWMFRFAIEKRLPRKSGGGWERREF